MTEIPTYRCALPADTQPLEKPLQEALNRTLVASIGPVASAALREFDIKVGLESRPTKLGALMSALETALS